MPTSLRSHHTFSLPVYAQQLLQAESIDGVQTAYQTAQRRGIPFLCLGEGSNVLFCDHFKGSVLLNRIQGVTVRESTTAWHWHVGAGCNWHQLVCTTLRNNHPGLENLAGIPGCVGAAPIQNIGAYGAELKDFCEYVDLLVLESNASIRLSQTECQFGYRESIFKHQYREGFVIIAVGLKLPKAWHPIITYSGLSHLNPQTVTAIQLLETVCSLRKQKLPDYRRFGHAGSFFKNPTITTEQHEILCAHHPTLPSHRLSQQHYKIPAAWLIEQVGLKGYRIGDAAVDQRNPLVLVNLGQATSAQVIALAKVVRKRVQDHFNIPLMVEIRFIGAEGERNSEKVLA